MGILFIAVWKRSASASISGMVRQTATRSGTGTLKYLCIDAQRPGGLQIESNGRQCAVDLASAHDATSSCRVGQFTVNVAVQRWTRLGLSFYNTVAERF